MCYGFKDGKKYILKSVSYSTKQERLSADKEEQILKLLKESCPYFINLIESFENV